MDDKMKKITLPKVALGLSTLALAISSSVHAAPNLVGISASNMNTTQEAPLPKRYIVKFKNENAAQNLSNASATDMASDSMSYEPRSNEVFSQLRVLNNSQAREMKRIGRSNSYSVKLDNKALKSLRLRADVQYVEEDVQRRFLTETTPWGQTYIGTTSLSDSQSGNRTICIIDSGYDRSHNDLSGNKVTGTNNSGTGNWYQPGANNAHGTHVAGTIAAIANNEGVVGVLANQNANIHVIKVFNEAGWGYSSSLVSAVDTCVSNGSNVVTMSLGGTRSSTTESNAMAAHHNNGVLLIAAAGNAGNSTHSYPASYDSVMSVAAVDSNRDHAAFSQYTNQVEISGPGEAILSTVTVGEGRLADVTIDGTSYFASGVVPHNRLVPNGTRSDGSTIYAAAPINASTTAELAECAINGTAFNCGNMSNKICLVERVGNQIPKTSFPEFNAVEACQTAGASGVIVYSNTALEGLQNPFLVDTNREISIPSMSVSRATGLALKSKVGMTVTVENQGNKDYEYYNGTSMATPHVSGVATLVWSYHPECSAKQIRAALNNTADDLGTAGRDNKTGYGMVNGTAAKAFLDASCTGPITEAGVLTNGVVKTSLNAEKGDALHYTFEVPAGAKNLSFTMSGGTGDADLYVQYGAAPGTAEGTYDCRPYLTGNNESCAIPTVQTGTYFVTVRAFDKFNGTSLVANYTPASVANPATYTNTTDYDIPDNNSTGNTSPITSTRNGDSGVVTVDVDIKHSYSGDLTLSLVTPTDQTHVLQSNEGGSADNIIKSFTANLTGVESSGVWKLKAVDSAAQDTGFIDAWTLTFK
jgi:serine protease